MESKAKLAGHAVHPMLITLPLGLLAAPCWPEAQQNVARQMLTKYGPPNEATVLGLNMVHELATGKRTVEEARHTSEQSTVAYNAGRQAPYAERLLFEVPQGGTEDPDESHLSGRCCSRRSASSRMRSRVEAGRKPPTVAPQADPGGRVVRHPSPGRWPEQARGRERLSGGLDLLPLAVPRSAACWSRWCGPDWSSRGWCWPGPGGEGVTRPRPPRPPPATRRQVGTER